MSEDVFKFTLPSGETVVVDAADRELVEKRGPWYALRRAYTTYVQRTYDEQERYLHRLLLDPPDDTEIDHVNRNGLDNRRSNLRLATRSQNMANSPPRRGKSKFKGVSWHKGGGCWQSRSRYNGTRYHIGLFDDEVEAAQAYDAFASEEWGEFAWLNRDYFDLEEDE